MRTTNPTFFRRLPFLALAAAALTLAILLAPLTAQAAAPGTPDSVAVARSNGTLTATWDAVNGATSYHVTYSSDNGASWSLAALDHPASGGGAESIAIGGVDNAETYLVGVLAKNANGSGAWRNSEPAGPYTPPPPPAAVGSIAVARADGSLTASWDAVDGATKHHVTYSSNNGASWSLAAIAHPSNSITFAVTNADTYIVGVRTGNDGGWSAVWVNSPASGPYTPPPTPTPTPTPAPAPSVTAERNDDGVSGSVTWTAYAGDDFSYYRVIVCTDAQYDGSSCSGTVHKSAPVYDAASTGPVSVTGLEGTSGYGVILQTWRTGGALKSHAAIPAVPAPSDAPSNFTATSGDGYYDLDWDAVSGATAYDIRAKVANSASWSSVATGVTATSYRYTTSNVVNVLAVRGGNASGTGPWAELSRMPSNNWLNVVIQGGASAQSAQGQSQLAAPASITVTRDNYPEDEKLNVSWDAVTGAGGYNLACAASPPSNTPLSSVSWWHCGSVDSGSTTTFTVDKDKRDGRDQDLSIWRSYAVAVRAVTIDPAQASPWLLSATAHPARVPERATMSVSRATGSVSVSWTPPNHAQGYEIECAAYDLTETPQGPPSNEPSYTLCADVETATVTNGKIDVTISSWTAGGTDYTVDDAKTYDLKVRTTNAWGESPDALAPLIYPADMLTVSNTGATTATLNIAHYSGNWYYKADKSPDRTCRGPVGGSTKDLTGLTAYTDYVYSAYSNSRCSAFRLLDTASFTTLPSISNLTNTVAGDADITRTTGQAIAFTTGANPGGYALKTLTAKLKKKGSPTGTLRARLYQMQGSGPYTKDSEPSSTILATLTGTPPTSASWTDTDYTCSGDGCQLDPNTTYFIRSDNNDGSAGSANVWSWAYTLSGSETKAPTNNGWDIQYGHTYLGGGNWQSYEDWLVAEIAFETLPSLTASNVAATTATLTIATHGGGAWYYKHTNTGATCDGPVATTTKDLTGLDAGTSYTYSAYSDSTCTTGNKLATAAAFTTLSPTLTASGVGATTATLTIATHGGGAWYYKHTNAGATCDGPVAAGTSTKDLTGLTAGTSYTYSAYTDSACTTGNLLATASQFTTPVSVSTLGGSENETYQVGQYLYTPQQAAQAFTTGSNTGGYTLSSIDIQIKLKVGSPTNLVVTLHAASGLNPNTSTTLATLGGDSSPDPSSPRAYTYTCSGSGCALSAGTTYFVLLKAPGSLDTNYYSVSLTTTGETKQPSGNGWSIANNAREKLAENWYNASDGAVRLKVTAVPEPSLDASGVTASGATLTVAHVNGAWYYKRTAGSPADATCRSVAAGTTTATLTGLTAGTSYTYKAYDASGCADADEVASAQFTTPVTVSNLSQSTSGRFFVGNNGSVYANQFHTGGNSSDNYTLSGVTADFAGKTGSPGALQMQVWTDSNGSPGSRVSGLTLGGNDPPASGGQATHTCSGNCTLTGNTNYWVRLSASGGSGNYWRWNYTSSGTETVDPSGNGWQIGDNKSYVAFGSIWIDVSGYFKIKVTAVPD